MNDLPRLYGCPVCLDRRYIAKEKIYKFNRLYEIWAPCLTCDDGLAIQARIDKDYENKLQRLKEQAERTKARLRGEVEVEPDDHGRYDKDSDWD